MTIIPMTPGPVDLDTPGGRELLARMDAVDNLLITPDEGVLTDEEFSRQMEAVGDVFRAAVVTAANGLVAVNDRDGGQMLPSELDEILENYVRYALKDWHAEPGGVL